MGAVSGGVSQAVCTAIRDDIVSGFFAQGDRLAEEHLARRYGVSRVPVREALRTLESEGFVTTERHVGACVAEPTAQDAADLLEIRALLEPLGAARAAQRRTEAHLRVLHGLVRLGRERARRGHVAELPSLSTWFHETLAQATGSRNLAALLVQLRRKVSWLYGASPAARSVESWDEHGAIADAVARGDAERAGALAVAHVERSTGAYELRRTVRRVSSRKHAVNTGGDQP
ncbi:GntR family transcriptional regulator [Streptomyces sp. MAR4 CNX-425]|uniref:GntR family transcriptional regulator n=1 Tax=Streptomyces sp. MAR4 CNX-425 TaxID=3406343 RepID=UPI003B50ACE1